MTTLAALIHDGTIVMASDSAGTTGDGRRWHRTRSKIARLTAGAAEVLIATCGPTSLNAFVHFDLKLDAAPDPTDDADCDRWAHAVAEAVTSWAAEAKPTVLEENGHLDGGALLGYAARLWTIHEHHADRISTPYIGLGSGGDVAAGALAVAYLDVQTGRRTPEGAARLAVQTAMLWDDGTAGDVRCEALPAAH